MSRPEPAQPPAPDAGHERALHFDAPVQAPFLWPTVFFMLGIWLYDTRPVSAQAALWLGGLLGLLALSAGAGLSRRHTTLAGLLLLCGALGAGWVRHAAALRVPAHHVSHLFAAEQDEFLTRVAAEVLTRPASRPAEKRNPFVPFAPSPKTRFVAGLRELRTTNRPTPLTGNVRVTLDAAGCELRPGDRIVLTGTLYRLRGPQNPGEPDWAAWNQRQGIHAGLHVRGPEYLRRQTRSGEFWRRAVEHLRTVTRMLLLEPEADVGREETRRLLDTMVLGQRSAAGQRINEAFQRAGGMHFLAVSGFHVAALAGAAWLVLHFALRRERLAALGVLAIVVLYAIVAEPNAPILRAAVMVVLALVALLLRRDAHPVNLLALATLLILFYNPLELFRPGFQFSVVLVFMLVGTAGSLHRLVVRRAAPRILVPLRRLRRSAAQPDSREAHDLLELIVLRTAQVALGLLALSTILWIVALPLCMWHFGRVALWGPLGAALLAIPVTVLIWLGFLTLLGNALFPPIGQVLSSALDRSVALLWELVRLFDDLPAALIEVNRPPAVAVVLAYGLLFGATVYVPQARSIPRRTRFPTRTEKDLRTARHARALVFALGLIGCLLCLPTAALSRPDHPADFTAHFLSVGNGSATIIAWGDKAALFDAGTVRNQDVGAAVCATLRTLGTRRLEAVFISHANFDHYSGVPTVLREHPDARIHTNPYFARQRAERQAVRDFFKLLAMPTPTVNALQAGTWLDLAVARVEVLWPPAGLPESVWRANDRSLVLRLHVAGRTILLPGDLDRAGLRGLLAAATAGNVRLTSDVLVAPHHGAVVGTETAALLRAVGPEVVIVSAAEQRAAFDALALDARCRVFTTGSTGAIRVTIQPDGALRARTPFLNPSPEALHPDR